MSKYIDADALLNKLPDDLPYKGSVKRVLMQAPAVNEWVSVKERLPDRSGTYLVIGKRGTPHAAHYYTGKRGFSNPYATHWMPMPEPPKGEKNEMQK